MEEKTVVITERDGKYSIQNNGLSDFALIGILECILFEMKSAHRTREDSILGEKITPASEAVEAESGKEESVAISAAAPAPIPPDQEDSVPDLRVRIGKAIKAIKELGGEVGNVNIEKMSEEELQSEFDELTTQYKRLKSSQASKKR